MIKTLRLLMACACLTACALLAGCFASQNPTPGARPGAQCHISRYDSRCGAQV